MKPNNRRSTPYWCTARFSPYVSNTQRIEISRLQKQSLLYPEYFSSELMSPTAISRSISDLLNTERANHGLEPIYFKLEQEPDQPDQSGRSLGS